MLGVDLGHSLFKFMRANKWGGLVRETDSDGLGVAWEARKRRRILDFISGMVRFGFVNSEMGMIMLTTWLPWRAVKWTKPLYMLRFLHSHTWHSTPTLKEPLTLGMSFCLIQTHGSLVFNSLKLRVCFKGGPQMLQKFIPGHTRKCRQRTSSKMVSLWYVQSLKSSWGSSLCGVKKT